MAKKRAKTKAVTYPLARVGDPYVTPDGTIYQPVGANLSVEKNRPKLKAKNYKPTTQRNIAELGADSSVLNGIGCVLVYTLLGVSRREIAEALRITEDDIKEIQKHATYGEMFDLLKDEFINANSDMLQARIAAYSSDALTNMAELAFRGKHEVTQFRATQDLLDRSGVSRKVGAQGNGAGDNALRIVVTSGDSSTKVSVGGKDIVPN